jgi:hypothetical protein
LHLQGVRVAKFSRKARSVLRLRGDGQQREKRQT